jgi:hypothetical protein
MTINDISTQLMLSTTLFAAALSGALWFVYTRNKKRAPKKRKHSYKRLTLFAIALIWLIGNCATLMVVGFYTKESTESRLLQASSEVVLLIALALLFVVSGIMMKHSASQEGNNSEYFSLIVKHLFVQMICIVVITMLFAITHI